MPELSALALTALILDEDRENAAKVATCLQSEGFNLAECHDDAPISEIVKRENVDICIVGTRALGRDGYDVVRELRLHSPAGIVMLGQSADEIDIVLALEMGADDYLIKSVSPRELCARIRTVLRRTIITPPDSKGARPLPVGFLRRVDDVAICGVLRKVSVGSRIVELTPSEFDVLMVLASNTNSVLSRDHIIASARGGGFAINDRAVDGVICRLRRKLFDADEAAQRIRTVHGRGYMMVEGG